MFAFFPSVRSRSGQVRSGQVQPGRVLLDECKTGSGGKERGCLDGWIELHWTGSNSMVRRKVYEAKRKSTTIAYSTSIVRSDEKYKIEYNMIFVDRGRKGICGFTTRRDQTSTDGHQGLILRLKIAF